ncbi:trehalose/maltose ABC transporter permease [Vibrio nigripulchritudo]|uniref:carbohydrate ABC transporter permease n=1 Tax=Vibrio nigripulchritudo TaxID=28173 RepID=UPI001909CC2A|nr:carbohydrate ABC transporter permease [Vibrio nigripulchritudo]BCL72154.1 trehalose/maltose ABC transporter permease [Vibrio nigripulchritudo]BDU33512.1 trehalose/maltose ABC transporter permease [Vibrio nigripulchritudo]
MKYSTQTALSRALFYLLVIIIALYTLFPFYWSIVSSFKQGANLFKVEFFPTIHWDNYISVLSNGTFIRNIFNSLFVATAVVVLSLVLSVTAAYALGRVNFKGRTAMLMAILSVSMFPQVVILSGLLGMINLLGLYNTLWALIVSYMIFTLPFTVWVITTFMKELPQELEDAARMDGCSTMRIITHVFFPILAPALVSTGLLAFIAAWNEFLFALTFVLNDEVRTVPVAIALISGASRYELPFGAIMAASVIVTVPLVVLVLIFQRKIVSGLTAGAIKG